MSAFAPLVGAKRTSISEPIYDEYTAYVKDRLAINKKRFSRHVPLAGGKEVLIWAGMSLSVSRMVTLALAVLVLGAAATASARPKKPSAEPASGTRCLDTPIIVQSLDCARPAVRVQEQQPATTRGQEQQPATERTQRPRVTARGSGGPYIPSLQPTPSLTLPQPPAGPYIPPPVNNPSERIMQLNQSFPLNGGLGNNPTNRDDYIRYNLTR